MEPGKGMEPSGTGFIIVALLLSAILFIEQPFQGSRPGQGSSIDDSATSEGKVPSRLWQDPFDAIQLGYKYYRASSGAKSDSDVTSDPLCKEPSENLFENRARKAHVIAVMVPSGPYAEDRETRLRARYAVLSSLGVSAYAPEDDTHIRCMQLKSKADQNSSEAVRIPYEWFLPESKGNNIDILILWLPEGHLGDRPLQQLASLVEILRAPLTLAGKEPPEFTILGPQSSGTLLNISKELVKRDSYLESLRGTRMISPTATVDEKLLYLELLKGTRMISPTATVDKEPLRQKAYSGDFLKFLYVANGEFRRTILTDRKITDAILGELQLRGVDIDPSLRPWQEKFWYGASEIIFSDDKCTVYKQHRDHIVLISEWDTFYGRSLPKAFRHSVNERISQVKEDSQPGTPEPKESDLDWIHSFNYMRGLDGEIPANISARQSSSSGTAKATSKTATEKPEEKIQRATGTHRFDYLRRLSKSIEELDRSLKKNYCGSVKAVGILGSDVYDKLLILQALRERFRNTLFFTVDMDARYLHPAEYSWARNLIVGSSFGLQPKYKAEKIYVPPFRDSYQTSRFTAIQVALNPKELKLELEPRIFEIGRGIALDLTVQTDDDHSSMIPGRYHAGSGLFTVVGIAIFLLLFIFIVGHHTLRYFGYSPKETLIRLQGLLSGKEKEKQSKTPSQEMVEEQELMLIGSILFLWASALVWGLIDLGYLLISGVVTIVVITAGWADQKFLKKTLSFLERHSVSNVSYLILLLSILTLEYSSILQHYPGESSRIGSALISGFTTLIFALSVLLLVLAGLKTSDRNGVQKYFSDWNNVGFVSRMVIGLSIPGLIYSFFLKDLQLIKDNRYTLSIFAILALVAVAIAVFLHYQRLKGPRFRADRKHLSKTGALLACLAILITLTIGVLLSADNHSGEPFSLFYGVSMWPGEAVRILAGLVSTAYLLICWKVIGEADRKISLSYFPDRKCADSNDNKPDYQNALNRIRATWCHTGKAEEFARLNPDMKHEPPPELWWACYDHFRGLGERWRSVLFPALLFFLLGCVAIHWLDSLHIPFRGEFVYRLDYVLVSGFMVPLFVILLFSVVDETSLCVGWILRMIDDTPAKNGKYSYYLSDAVRKSGFDDFLRQAVPQNPKEDKEPPQDNCSEIWLRLQIIAKRSQQVGSLIPGPFVVLFLILLAQSPYFDNWDVPPGLVAMIMLSALYAIGCAVKLRKVSERARQSAVQALTQELTSKGGSDKRIELVLREVKELRSGGFLPWSHQPWLKAALWLLSAIGIMSAQYSSLGMF